MTEMFFSVKAWFGFKICFSSDSPIVSRVAVVGWDGYTVKAVTMSDASSATVFSDQAWWFSRQKTFSFVLLHLRSRERLTNNITSKYDWHATKNLMFIKR